MRMRKRLQAAGEDVRRAIGRSGFPLAPAACTRDFLAGLVFAAAMLAPAAAHAIPYFNAPPVEGMSFGFDQDALAEPLPIDVDVPLDAGFPPVVFTTPGGAGGGAGSAGLIVIVEEIILDSDTMMEREITLTILNTRPDLYTDVTFLLTGLGPETPPDFYGEDVVIEVLIDALDPMDIIAFDVWTMAGFYLALEDFEQTPEGLAAVRSFSYTVNIPEPALGPPQMGGAIAIEGVLVPEPGTGLLLAGALALVAAAGRRR